jgi:rod shape-determining protein MreD|tara:strand:+ start:1676 stop:2185 length:510 start_codon:yes stop_codon:yes gene_type:complete
MNALLKSKEVIFKNLPLIILYILSFNSFEGLKLYPNLLVFSFNLQMIIVYFYVLKYPDEIGYGHIFIVGIINDVVTGIPLGTTSLSYLILCFFTSYIRNVTLRSKMSAEWFAFIPALFFSNLIYFIIINNFTNLSFYYVELLRNSFFSFLFFPIFYYIFNKHQTLTAKD